MKTRLIAAAACAIVAGQAHALNVATTTAAPVQVYLSGSSALKAVIAGMMSQNSAAGTFTNFKSDAATFGDTSAGASYNIYSGTMIAGNDFGLPAGTNVALHTRQRGGSYQGVVPVAKNQAITFLNIAGCSDTTLLCTTTINRAPDGGISDEEPAIMANAVNVPAGQATVAVANSDFLDPPKAVAAQVFGVAVSNALYTALGGVIGAGNVPTTVASVPKTGVTTMLASGFDPSILGWNPVGLNSTQGVNINRRANGSGTQAAFNLFFFDLPSSTLAVLPSSAADTPGCTVTSLAGDICITEESSSDNVIGKLNAANAAGAYAMGVLTLDKDPSLAANGLGWNFVAIDGITASRDNFKVGKYAFGFESTIQINKTASTAALGAGTFMRAFRDQFGLTKNIAQLSAEGQKGVAALPGNVPGASGTWIGNDLTFGSRVTRGGDSRAPLVFTK